MHGKSLSARLDRLEGAAKQREALKAYCDSIGMSDADRAEWRSLSALVPAGSSTLEAAQIIGKETGIHPGDIIAEARRIALGIEGFA